jgi:Zn finger protein HypA/HybF involved in hydrogenase expression
MHEYALMERVMESILKRLEEELPARVVEVSLKIGVLELHSQEATRMAFQVLAQGTPLEKSRLTLTLMPVYLECPACGHTEPYLTEPLPGHEPLPGVRCPKCQTPVGLLGGIGVEAIELILAEPE